MRWWHYLSFKGYYRSMLTERILTKIEALENEGKLDANAIDLVKKFQ